jgi:hypothetical protein
MVLRGRIELPTSSLPMMCSTTELPQQAGEWAASAIMNADAQAVIGP